MIEISIIERTEADSAKGITRFLRTVDTANVSAVVYAIDAALVEPIAAPLAPPAEPPPRKKRKDAGKPRAAVVEPPAASDAQLSLS